MNDLHMMNHIGQSVDEARRLVQVFQFTVSFVFLLLSVGLVRVRVLIDKQCNVRMNMGKYVRRTGRRAPKRFVRIRPPSWSTLPPPPPPSPLKTANRRTEGEWDQARARRLITLITYRGAVRPRGWGRCYGRRYRFTIPCMVSG